MSFNVNELKCNDYRESVTEGIPVTGKPVKVSLLMAPAKNTADDFSEASLIVFDSYDGLVHDERDEITKYRYTEFGEVWFDGHIINTGARDMEVSVSAGSSGTSCEEEDSAVSYEITAYRQKDHIRIIIESFARTVDVIIALPDSSLYSYISLTGEHCHISGIKCEQSDTSEEPEDIRRIADPVNYIDRLESDIPNVQIDGKRTASTVGVPVTDGMRLDFHTMSLPSADHVWHCPYVVLFSSDDGKVGGANYREYALVKLNGETADEGGISKNVVTVAERDDFGGWDWWKEQNRKGFECEVRFNRRAEHITVRSCNAGLDIENVTVINDGARNIYAAITGDQCAITDIRIR